jgi:hypothetical protein
MGRRHTPEHHQAVVDDWRRRLLAIPWGKAGAAGAARLLIMAVGGEFADSHRQPPERHTAAARTLQAAMLAVGDARDRPDAVDAWIDRHLVRQGADLLIPEELRRTAFARARDAHRRQAHAGEGLHSARIEMRQAGWNALREIRARLEADGSTKLSLGAALEQIIAAHDSKARSTVRRKTSGQTQRNRPAAGDLFAAMEAENPPAPQGDELE